MLESLAAEAISENMIQSVANDLATLPVLNEKGIRKTIERSSARGLRASELRLLNIYQVEDQLRRDIKGQNATNEISLSRLYKLAESKGVFDAFDEHYTEENSTPLL